MTWSIGDKWEYRYTTTTMILKMTAEITGESTIDIDGVNYDVFVRKLTGELEMIDVSSILLGTTLVQGSTITGTSYVAKENDETTKSIQNLRYQLVNETNGKFINLTQTIVSITVATSGGKPDVIYIGDIWASVIKTITNTTTTFSGSLFDYYTPGYTNTTTTTTNVTEDFSYECIGIKNVTTDAGKFDYSYEIRRSKIGEDGYLTQYISLAVKNEVEDIAYDSSGNMMSRTELISYDVAAPATPEPSEKTPGFELVIVICSIAIILLWKRKRVN